MVKKKKVRLKKIVSYNGYGEEAFMGVLLIIVIIIALVFLFIKEIPCENGVGVGMLAGIALTFSFILCTIGFSERTVYWKEE